MLSVCVCSYHIYTAVFMILLPMFLVSSVLAFLLLRDMQKQDKKNAKKGFRFLSVNFIYVKIMMILLSTFFHQKRLREEQRTRKRRSCDYCCTIFIFIVVVYSTVCKTEFVTESRA